MSQKGFANIAIIFLIGGILVIVWYLFNGSAVNKPSNNSTNSIPTEAPSLTTPEKIPASIKTKADPNPQRKSCPEGFYYYENSTYSICYPDKLTAYIADNVVDQATGEMDTRVIDMPDDEAIADLTVLPSFTAAGGINNCSTSENVTVSGYKAVRHTDREHVGDGCGKITGLVTIIQTGKSLPFWLMYQSYVGGDLRFINDYPTIEQSLKIKY